MFFFFLLIPNHFCAFKATRQMSLISYLTFLILLFDDMLSLEPSGRLTE